MVYISSNSNGQFGFGMSGALYPTNMGGPFGNKHMQLPSEYQYPAKMFGKRRKKSKKSKKRSRKYSKRRSRKYSKKLY